MTIEMKGVCKSFEGRPVLQKVSLQFAPGSITCLMGPSGQGKTTLLRLLAGTLTPDEGTITGLPACAGLVPQQSLLLPEFSARFNAGLTQKKVAPAVLDAALKAVGLQGCEEVKAEDLSGGMQRRVAVVRAVLCGAPLLLLDEPFEGLDAENKRLTAQYILANRGEATVVMVSHDPEDAALMGAQVVQLWEDGMARNPNT